MVLDQHWAAADSGPGQPTSTLSRPENSCWSPCTRKLISACYSFIDPKRMKGWVDLVGWPAADILPTWLVTRQLQVGRRTGKDRRPKTDVLPLSQRHQLVVHNGPHVAYLGFNWSNFHTHLRLLSFNQWTFLTVYHVRLESPKMNPMRFSTGQMQILTPN